MSGRARVAFLWHMHQPYYRDTVSGRASLPWVRLHAVKDYHPMARIIARFPGLRMTVNFVPSLVKQILEYATEGLRDDAWDASCAPPGDLTEDQRRFILRNFFMTNWNRVVHAHPRYLELLEKRGRSPSDKDLLRAATLFSAQDWLDLQVWFNLGWFHPLDLEQDQVLADMVRRGRGFREEERGYVLDRQLAMMREVVPLYRGLADSGQVELSTSPFYHPILPLVVDTRSALEALPSLALPSPGFARPADAALQLSRAVDYHTAVFGRPPAGLWPSEGSVSEGMLPLVMASGFRWLATDEDILYKSAGVQLQHPLSEEERCRLLYRPYRLQRDGRALAVVFRDHFISDTIGFTYGHWDPAAAAGDLLGRLDRIARVCGYGPEPLIPVILDGENPWEFYPRQGQPFLEALFGGLERSTALRGVTVSGALDETPAGESLPRLFAGSWIAHNFQIWIGHPEDRRAWELLARAREALDLFRQRAGEGDPAVARALEEILIAEGSDWCWWYGEENSSGNDEAFDELYRLHLQNVYTLAGLEIPADLKVSIFTGPRGAVPIARIYSFVKPVIDGRVTSYFEWLAAGEYPVVSQGGTMHRADVHVAGIFYGFDPGHLFLRVDPVLRVMANDLSRYAFVFSFLRPSAARVEVTAAAGQPPLVSCSGTRGGAGEVHAALKDILELDVPFASLGATTGDRVDFFVSILRDGQEIELWPHRGFLSVTVPAPDFEEKSWSI